MLEAPVVRLRWAHPRSRGENDSLAIVDVDRVGSSPLTRGKRTASPPHTGGAGLIPAHAGKTRKLRGRRILDAAHPRSRGENSSLYL